MKFYQLLIRMFLSIFLIFGVALLGSVTVIMLYFRHVADKRVNSKEVLVEIPHGSSLRRVSSILHLASVIDNPKNFYWYLRLGRADGNRIQAGYYQFSGSCSYSYIASRLLHGVDRAYRITFREGQTLVDLAQTLANAGLVSEEQFANAITSKEIATVIDAPNSSSRKSLKNDVGGIEGYLFPDTYFFSKGISAQDIIKTMHGRLLDVIRKELIPPMAGFREYLHYILTLASIVEKETGNEPERGVIASVYKNRLDKGMRLQADPTVIYGIKNYDGNIRKKHLLTHHIYNTYTINGLPPGPIAAVGIHAIRAAIRPSATNYFYFVAKNDGTHEFCDNFSCHQRAVKKWQINYLKNPIHSNKK